MLTKPVRPRERSCLAARRILSASIIAIIGIIFSRTCSFAADWSFTPSVTFSEEYDSNITFSSTFPPGVPKGDYITCLEPVFSIMGETDTTKFLFATDTTGEKYIENPSFDTINTNTYTSLTELWSPRFTTDANFRFIHDYTLENELETSGIATQKTERYQYNAGGDVKYAITGDLNLQAAGSYIDTMYPSHPSGLPDYNAYTVTVTPVWSISPRMDIGLSSNFVRQDYPSFSAEMNTVTEMIYWKRLLTPTTSLGLSAGYYYTWTSYVTQVVMYIPPGLPVLATVPGSGSGSGPAAAANLKQDWSQRFSTTLMAGRSQYDDPYARSFAKTCVGLSASYRLSELTTVNLRATYDMDDQITQGNLNIDYIYIGPVIEQRISENIIARLRGSYELQTNSNTGGSPYNINRYIVWIELTYKLPRLWSSH